jgi:hypothetical protein
MIPVMTVILEKVVQTVTVFASAIAVRVKEIHVVVLLTSHARRAPRVWMIPVMTVILKKVVQIVAVFANAMEDPSQLRYHFQRSVFQSPLPQSVLPTVLLLPPLPRLVLLLQS